MYRFASELIDPYRLLILLLATMCGALWFKLREHRRRLALLVVPCFLLVLISTPAVCFVALGTLEWRFSPIVELPAESQAVIVLSGWWMPADDYRQQALLGHDSIYRCLHAAELCRTRPCPIVLSGGQVEDRGEQPSIARLMQAFMIELRIPESTLIVEDQSRSTFESAQECRRLLAAKGIDNVTLVTEANHMRRASKAFEKAGFQVTPAPCDFKASQFEWRLRSFLPSADAAGGIQEALHEWLGLAWYWLHGRV